MKILFLLILLLILCIFLKNYAIDLDFKKICCIDYKFHKILVHKKCDLKINLIKGF